MNPNKSQTLEEFVKSKNGIVTIINGAYGNYKVPHGVIEYKITPESGGTFYKLLGCTFLHKNHADRDLMNVLDVAKSALTGIMVMLRSGIVQFYLVLLFLFNRKHLYKVITRTIKEYLRVVHRPLKSYIVEPIRYCRAVRELRQALLSAILRTRCDIRERLYDLMDVFVMIIEYDNAYRIRLQDVLALLDKGNLEEDPQKEINRLLDILIDREAGKGMRDKWRKLKGLILFSLLFSKIRKEVILTLDSLDLLAIAIDPADHYFSLMWSTYSVNGASLEDRAISKEQLDKILGHRMPDVLPYKGQNTNQSEQINGRRIIKKIKKADKGSGEE